MLRGERSTTTLSTSATSNPSATDIQYVKGVGPKLGALLKSRGLNTVKDLLHYFPRAYEDRSRFLKVSELQDGESATVAVIIQSSRQVPMRGRPGRNLMEARCSDETGSLGLKWFYAPRGMIDRLKSGTRLVVTGQVKLFMGRPEIVHPELSWGEVPSVESTGRVIPVYPEIEGVPSRMMRKLLWSALEKFSGELTEDLPECFRHAHGLPGRGEAIRCVHFPPETDPVSQLIEFDTPAQRRIIYEEFLKFEYLVLRKRANLAKERAIAYGSEGGKGAVNSLEASLPFRLTEGQRSAIGEILEDLACPHPMNRLLQGDVGSGKTAVALLTAGCVLAEGSQVAFMAPTEILAAQHFQGARRLFEGKLNVALLTGSTPAAERARLLDRLARGEPILLIGTHALLEDPVVFADLGFLLIDEQHRFGVEQRRLLRKKGARGVPHALVLTATPIPRTLALTYYGDLAVTSIREMPPGRSPVETKLVRGSVARSSAYERIRGELKTGRQAYFIYPLVNDSEAEGFTHLKSAIGEAERLGRETFPEFKVGLLHGQQKPDEKAAVMNAFKEGELHILVSTTVVEVGVDVPNATVIAVEHAERFGLSQLHQLRGRVGRGQWQSYCFLMTEDRVSETTAERLAVMEKTTDGFKIAEADLRIRGPGEFLGTRQAGSLPFRFADLVRDQDWLVKAREDAYLLLKQDPDLLRSEHLPLRRYYEREGKLQFERLRTS